MLARLVVAVVLLAGCGEAPVPLIITSQTWLLDTVRCVTHPNPMLAGGWSLGPANTGYKEELLVDLTAAPGLGWTRRISLTPHRGFGGCEFSQIDVPHQSNISGHQSWQLKPASTMCKPSACQFAFKIDTTSFTGRSLRSRCGVGGDHRIELYDVLTNAQSGHVSPDLKFVPRPNLVRDWSLRRAWHNESTKAGEEGSCDFYYTLQP